MLTFFKRVDIKWTFFRGSDRLFEEHNIIIIYDRSKVLGENNGGDDVK
jgi:hypothetical protein